MPSNTVKADDVWIAQPGRARAPGGQSRGSTQDVDVTVPPAAMMADHIYQIPADLLHASIWFK